MFEELSTVEPDSVVDPTTQWERQSITVLSDFMFHGMTISSANQIAQWTTDETFTSQVNYELKTPCKLVCSLPNGPDIDLSPNETLVSPRAVLVCHASTERELRGRDIRQTWKGLAPWTHDNPLMLHLTSTADETVRTAIDQCAECGFEMVIFSFGSGLNMEDTSAQNIQKFKTFADYAHSKRIRIGGYSLLASRSVAPEHDVIAGIDNQGRQRRAVLEQGRDRHGPLAPGIGHQRQARAAMARQTQPGQTGCGRMAERHLRQRFSHKRLCQRADQPLGPIRRSAAVDEQPGESRNIFQRRARIKLRQRGHRRRDIAARAPLRQRRVGQRLRGKALTQPRDIGVHMHRQSLPARRSEQRLGRQDFVEIDHDVDDPVITGAGRIGQGTEQRRCAFQSRNLVE